MKVLEAPHLGERAVCLEVAGMPVYLLPKPGFRATHVWLSVDYGSIDRRFRLERGPVREMPDGVAHFLEHRLFATPKGDVGDRFAALGAEVNAHTTFTNTAYFFSTTDELDACLELLLDFVLRPALAPEGVDREREIILHELQLYGDNHEWINFIDVLQALYGGHPLGVDIAGTPGSIAAIDHDVLRRCHAAFYQPANLTLIAAGDFEPEAVANTLGRCLAGTAPSRAAQAVPVPATPGSTRRRVTRMPVALPRVCLGFADLGPLPRGPALLRQELCAELLLDLLFGASSEFYRRHYESGLIDGESFGCEVYLEPEFAFCLIGGDTPDPERLAGEIERELERAVTSDLIDEGFARAARRAYGQAVQRLDQVEGAVGAVYSGVGRGAGPFGLFAAHAQLQPDDLRQYLVRHLLTAPRGEARIVPGRMEQGDGR